MVDGTVPSISNFIFSLRLISVVLVPSWGVCMHDPVKREGLYYKQFTYVPFNGKTDEVRFQRSFQNGKYHGPYEYYHGTG